jgi:predicted metal-binding membrane protein
MGMGAASVPMMLPSAVPAIVRRARERDGALAAPLFAGSYVGTWALVAVAMCLLYRPPGAVTAGALVVGAGLYELTPLKRECRRRCRERVRSGLRFGVYCFGSSIGLMLVLVAVDVMSIALMFAIAVVVLAQKLLPPRPPVDPPLALAIIALGVAIAAT